MARMLVALLVLVLVGAPLRAQPCGDACGTTVSASPQPGDVWTLDGSPYCVTNDIVVNGLTIEPGVCVYVDEGRSITVQIVLIADAAGGPPITFTSRDPDGRWGGLEFNNNPPGSILRNCIIERSSDIGVELFSASPMVFEDCVIRDNLGPGDGAGIRITSPLADLTIRRCVIENNGARSNGGGVWGDSGGSLVTLSECRIVGNRANSLNSFGSYGGGGLLLRGAFELRDCLIAQNNAHGRPENFVTRSGDGGGMFADSGSIILENCVFEGNSASCASGGQQSGSWARGGGAWIGGSACINLRNCIFGGNQLNAAHVESGGGIFLASSGSPSLIEHCTFARNDRAGIHLEAGEASVRNSIVFFNNNDADQILGTPVVTYSCVQNGYAGEGNIQFSPGFAGLGTSLCDLEITSFSPCVDAGDPNSPADSDQCSDPPFNAPRADMGAHGGPLACWTIVGCPSIANLNRDCAVDSDDFFEFLDAFASGEFGVCDLTGSSNPDDPSYGIPDGDCDADDFFFFLDAFANGCL